jgi:hypothetical protein
LQEKTKSGLIHFKKYCNSPVVSKLPIINRSSSVDVAFAQIALQAPAGWMLYIPALPSLSVSSLSHSTSAPTPPHFDPFISARHVLYFIDDK